MNINELELKNEVILTEDIGLDELPEELGPFTPPPQPGPYRFRLPADLTEVWSKFDTDEGERISAYFADDAALEITQSKSGQETGSTLRVGINNRQRARGANKVPVSDMDYLLRSLEHASRPTTNRQYIEALTSHAGEEFAAEVEWSAYCNPKKDIYALNEETGRDEKAEGTFGCGQSHYQKDIPRENGIFIDRFPCKSCGAVLRARPQLVRFKSVRT